MIQPEELVGEEWAEWYRLTPAQRWLESEKLWQTYLALGGSLDPEPDTQSPFFDARAPRPRPAHGRTSVRILRRGPVKGVLLQSAVEGALKRLWSKNLAESLKRRRRFTRKRA